MFLFVTIGIGVIVAVCYVLFQVDRDKESLQREYEEMKIRRLTKERESINIMESKEGKTNKFRDELIKAIEKENKK